MTEEFPFTKGRRRPKSRRAESSTETTEFPDGISWPEIAEEEFPESISWPEITEERIEWAMRRTSPEQIMEILRCTTPGRGASTRRWVAFLAEMRARSETPEAKRAIEEAEQELARRLNAVPTQRGH